MRNGIHRGTIALGLGMVFSATTFAQTNWMPSAKNSRTPIVPGIVRGAIKPTVPTYESNTILIKTNGQYQPRLTNATLGAAQIREFGFAGWRQIRLPAGVSVPQAVAIYAKMTGVVAAEPNYIRPWSVEPNDPLRSQCWHIDMVNMPQMWDLSIGSKSTVVAILDSGTDYTHADLAPNIVPGGYDFAEDDNDPMDTEGHGTHCAGDASAATNNNIGVASGGFNVGILPLKVGKDGAGGADTAAWIAALKYAADQGAKVASMSFGGPGKSQAEQDAVNYAWNKGMVVTAAAGNDGTDAGTSPNYPANLDNVLSVAATTQSDTRASFSCYGKTTIDIASPGTGILSTKLGGGYVAMDGTSMATPVVAGILGQMFAYVPTSTNVEVVDSITRTAIPKDFVIFGRVDAAEAVRSLVPAVYVNNTLTDAGFYPGSFNQSIAKVATLDGVNLAVPASLVKGVGQVAGSQFSFQQNSSTVGKEILSAGIDYSVSSNFSGTVQIFLKDIVTGQYRFISQKPYSAGSKSIDLSFDSNLQMTSSGRIDVMVRMLVPSNVGGTSGLQFNVDYVNFRIRYRNRGV